MEEEERIVTHSLCCRIPQSGFSPPSLNAQEHRPRLWGCKSGKTEVSSRGRSWSKLSCIFSFTCEAVPLWEVMELHPLKHPAHDRRLSHSSCTLVFLFLEAQCPLLQQCIREVSLYHCQSLPVPLQRPGHAEARHGCCTRLDAGWAPSQTPGLIFFYQAGLHWNNFNQFFLRILEGTWQRNQHGQFHYDVFHFHSEKRRLPCRRLRGILPVVL